MNELRTNLDSIRNKINLLEIELMQTLSHRENQCHYEWSNPTKTSVEKTELVNGIW